MRHIGGKDYNNPPSILLNNMCAKQIYIACENKNGEKYTGYYYRHKAVKTKLQAFSLGQDSISEAESAKCFYCESKIEHAASLQVEHYRPKAKVDAIDNNNKTHSGYFWLGNEWSNLILSCPACNGKSAKGNRFPIAGNRADECNPISVIKKKSKTDYKLNRSQLFANKSPLIDEKPILLNPEIDKPEDFLSFESNGKMIGIDLEQRGQKTIDILKLNRGKLQQNHQAVLNDFIGNLNLVNLALNTDEFATKGLQSILNAICCEIIKSMNTDKEYSLFGKYINDNFEIIAKNEFSNPFRKTLINTFNRIKTP